MTTPVSNQPTTKHPVDVSIIISAYNRLWCLPRAVDSCRNTRCSTQIIVVDDGSTDGTWEWLQTQPDLVAMRQDNQGQTWAINRGAAEASGRYVRFIDSDDFLTTGSIDRQFDAAESTGADVVYGRVDIRDEETGNIEVHPESPLWDDFIAVMLGEGYGSHFLGMLFRREFIAGIPRRPEFGLREDRAFLLEVALRHPKIAAVDGCIGYWTRHNQQMHTSYQGMQTTMAAWQMWKLYERALNRLQAAGELTPRRARAACRVLWCAAHAIAKTHLPDAVVVVQKIRELDPEFVSMDDPRLVRRLHALLGYVTTQRLLRVRRWLIGGNS